MTEQKREITRKGAHEQEREEAPMSKGWSARWDAQALGDVRSRVKAQEPPASSAQERTD